MRKGENPEQVLDLIHQKVKDLNQNILPRGVKIDTFYDRTNLMDFATETELVEQNLPLCFRLFSACTNVSYRI